MAEANPIELETDAEVADCVITRLTAPEWRALASNLGVSRERGDSKRDTVERVVAQEPGVAAAMADNDHEVDMDASAFRERRHVGEGRVPLDEMVERARSERLERRLRRLRLELSGVGYEGRAERFAEGLVSVFAEPAFDTHPLLEERPHAILTDRGAPRHLKVQSQGGDFTERYGAGDAWDRFLTAIGRMWDGGREDSA